MVGGSGMGELSGGNHKHTNFGLSGESTKGIEVNRMITEFVYVRFRGFTCEGVGTVAFILTIS